MGRPKKPISEQTKHVTNDEKSKRKSGETAVDQKVKDAFNTIPEELADDDAIKVWKEWVAYLKDIGFYGNVNVPELIGYCNAWAMNVKAQRKLKGASIEEASKLATTIKKHSEEMTRCMNRGGFSVSSRLNYAEQKLNSEMADIESKFGI